VERDDDVRAPVVKRLGSHTVIQFLSMTGIRQTSLLDNRRRPRGNCGRYLRWHHLQMGFIGYADDDQPEFQ
jgi:hypothetical protein